MTEIEYKIVNIIKLYSGIKAKDIASKCDLDRKTVNRYLYGSLKTICYQDSNFKWYLNNSYIRTKTPHKKTETPPHKEAVIDNKLNALCKYYLNCISLEGQNRVSVFQTSQFDLDYLEIGGIEAENIESEAARSFITKNLRNRKTLYVGYPVNLATVNGRGGNILNKLIPIFLFPIENEDGNYNLSSTPIINLEIIQIYSTKDSYEQIHELIKLEDDLGLNNPDVDFDAFELVSRLKSLRDWKWFEDLDPQYISNISNISNYKKEGIYNKAIIVSAETSPYTQGLESELTNLSKLSKDQYKGTALYSWVHGAISQANNATDNTALLEVLPLNLEQSKSVKQAISNELTIVTGPPGTGKSQVVTNLILNMAWNKKSAIFSSKNNKAVDVVEQRVNGLGTHPIMLRLGSNQNLSQLLEFLEDILFIPKANSLDKEDYDYYKKEYNSLQAKIVSLSQKKDKVMQLRNKIDKEEQRYCDIRDDWKNVFSIVSDTLQDFLSNCLENVKITWHNTQELNRSFTIRLLRIFYKKKADTAFRIALNELNKVSALISKTWNYEDFKEDTLQDISKTLNEVKIIVSYKRTLEQLKSSTPLEQIDYEIMEVKRKQHSIAKKVWNQWLKISTPTIPADLRQDILSLISQIKLSNSVNLSQDSELRKSYNKVQKSLQSLVPIFAITALSAKNRIPFTPGLFDLLIIDESSQCDIASILPLLFRAKRAVIIGDPKQLSHITSVNDKQDLQLLEKYDINPVWSYTKVSLYSYAEVLSSPDSIIKLRDHHRCHNDIIAFSNKEFYSDNLRIATNYNKLMTPPIEKPGIRWINVIGKTTRPISGGVLNVNEVNEVINQLQRLVECKYLGSIGVVTPFRSQASAITTRLEALPELYNTLISNNNFMADTVHKFQGDERDIIIFSTVVSDNTHVGAINFLRNTGNLFNVAITRARSTLVVIGNKQFCSYSSVSYLEHFVSYTDTLEIETKTPLINIESSSVYPEPTVPELISNWERLFYTALHKAGIKTIPQYNVDKFYLDLALLYKGYKLDIEVDGERYHRTWNQELCYIDQLRNQRLFELGWEVKRFWVYQLRDDLECCINQIQQWIIDIDNKE